MIQKIRQLLFDGHVDMFSTLRKDGDYKCWPGPRNLLTIVASSAELLELGSAMGVSSSEMTHATNDPLA